LNVWSLLYEGFRSVMKFGSECMKWMILFYTIQQVSMLHNILASKIFCEPLCRSIGKTHVRSECVSLLQTPSLELAIAASRFPTVWHTYS
jgi:hypothetical protein